MVLRGALYGVAAVPVAGAGALAVADHESRLSFLAVVGGFALIVGVCWIPVGGFLWFCCRGDIRRWRDWRSLTRHYDGASVMGPALLRVGVLGLVLGGGAWQLYGLVDAAGYSSWLYGR